MLPAFTDDPDSVPGTHVEVLNHLLYSISRRRNNLLPDLGGYHERMGYTDIHAVS